MANMLRVVPVLALAVLVACGDGSPSEVERDGAADASTPDAQAEADAGDDAGDAEVDAGYAWDLPPGFPEPKVPEDNPMTAEKVRLGRHLFYDKRLSVNGTQSCASCHEQAKAFADGRAVGLGATGEFHARGSMSLANVAYAVNLTWANPLQRALESQALVPMFGTAPIELGLYGKEDELLAMLRADETYAELFRAAFGEGDDAFSVGNVTRAIACFERTLISGTSPYDQYAHGDEDAISDAAKRGSKMVLESERFECRHCHGGFAFADSVTHLGKLDDSEAFHNTGLYNIGGTGAYPAENEGIKEITENERDMGRFKAPTLRNIALTAPYMHDGSIATLDEVLDHYAAGGRTITSGPNAGDGSLNRFKSEFVHGFIFSGSERADLLAFLESLTDEAFIRDPRHANPWPEGSPAHGVEDAAELPSATP